MPVLCLFSLAVIVTLQFPPLNPPRLAGYFAVLLLAALLAWRYKALRWPLLAALAGVLYCHTLAMQRIGAVLPVGLEQQDLALVVDITGLPVDRGRYWRSEARVVGDDGGQRLQLSWYGEAVPGPCQRWQITARLKRPHGLANPGAFDYAGYLLERGITARGYVREAVLLSQRNHCLAGLRQRWHDHIDRHLPAERALWLKALSTGDKSGIGEAPYRLLQAAGINHLFVISGLHIGMAAAAVYALVLGLRRAGGGLLWPGDWRPAAALLAILAALAYALLAGFTLPAQRALIMVAAFFGAAVLGVTVSLWLRFWLAMALVLLHNPLAAGNIGFALSFAAVAVLILAAHRRAAAGRLAGLAQMWRMQWQVVLGLAPLLVLFFRQASLLAPLVNLLAIPLVSLLVVPLLLLAFLLWAIGVDSGGPLWLADQLLHGLLWLVQAVLDALPPSLDWLTGVSLHGRQWWALLLLAGLLLLPGHWPGRLPLAALLLVLMLLMPARRPDHLLEVDVVDVGQGLAVLLRTANHNLLYDTGAAWPDGNMAGFAVLPVLQQRDVSRLDKLLISHFDNDHAGSMAAVVEAVAVDEVLAPALRHGVSRPCRAGEHWHWDGVDFYLLHPESIGRRLDNEQSCVLLVQAGGRQLLLPGDIGRKAEMQMLQRWQHTAGLPPPALDVLLAPHHGSRSSSSLALLAVAQGATVINSSGYRNRYGHPHSEVLQRYRQAGMRVLDTACAGLVNLRLDHHGQLQIRSFRGARRRYSELLYQCRHR